MGCNCNLSTAQMVPPNTVLETCSVAQLRTYANAHKLGPAGTQVGDGLGTWRATANRVDLLHTLKIHRDGGQSEVMPVMQAVDVQMGNLTEAEKAFKQMMAAMQPSLRPEQIQGMVNKAVAEAIDKARSSFMQITINAPPALPVDMGRQHKSFPALATLVGAKENVLMVGPAGSSKTTSAIAACKGMGRQYEIMSVGPQTMQSELAGYKNATGTYIESVVRRCYEQGKVLILDEMDAANPGVFTYMNAIIDNMQAGFPDGTVDRHDIFSLIGCANTWGTGADMQYVGRSQLDAATLDRFVALEWNYDETFEMDIALGHNPNAKEWVMQVQKWRANMFKHKIRHVISPRASIKGAKLLKLNFTQKQVEKMVVFKGLNKEAVDKIRQEA